ncbi:hypothetical protein BDY17DRAFT_20223 [Neohortaea acidophila]|uniref:Uncharacterized protein n=1 Tax=Neohortaea acidophila TaxID=245834 RepID=A0A6A6Q6D6_9PEZI|nr:uncharacterized protein BDY17DRAFT_20223 [Neohortaea acidophila]KAF2487875.1 hypothetical protein BDY17DRAFT_20223 [Neohortaea acidophila]
MPWPRVLLMSGVRCKAQSLTKRHLPGRSGVSCYNGQESSLHPLPASDVQPRTGRRRNVSVLERISYAQSGLFASCSLSDDIAALVSANVRDVPPSPGRSRATHNDMSSSHSQTVTEIMAAAGLHGSALPCARQTQQFGCTCNTCPPFPK